MYCRTAWQGDEDQVKRICREKTRGAKRDVNGDGYVNVAQELGISGARGESPWSFLPLGRLFGLGCRSNWKSSLSVDFSTYHQPWARRQGLGYY